MDAHGVMAGLFGPVGVVLVAVLMRSTVEQRWFLPLGLAWCAASLAAFAGFPDLAEALHWPADAGARDTYLMLSDAPDFGIVLIGAWILHRFVLQKK